MLVSCFSDSVLLPINHALELICSWNNCWCGICVPSNSTVSVGLIASPWLWPCTARMQIIASYWSSQYSIVGLSVERLSASHQSSLFQCWVSSASSMSNKSGVHRTAPSASWQPPGRKICVECLDMFPNSQFHLCFDSCWDSFPMSVTESNWCKLWLWRSCIPYWRMSTCRLCSRSPAAWRLRWWRGSRNLVVSLIRNNSVLRIAQFLVTKLTQVFDFVVSWRYLYFNHQSSCRFEHFNPDLGPIFKRSVRADCKLELWEFIGSKYSLPKREELFPPITDSLVMQNCQFSAVLAIAAWFRSFQNQHLSILGEWRRVASSLWHVSLFLRNQCQLLGFEIDLLFVFRCFRCEYFFWGSCYWRIRLPSDRTLLANMALMRISLFQNVPCKWKVFLLSSTVQARQMALSLAMKYWVGSMTLECVNHFVRFVDISIPPRMFLTRALRSTQCPGLNFGRKCCHFFGIVHTGLCIAFLCPHNVVEHRHEDDPRIKRFWILPVQVFLNMLLDVRSGSNWDYVPNESHFTGSQIHFLTKPCSFHSSSNVVAWLLEGCGSESPTQNAESENMWTFILIKLAAGSTQQRDSWPTKSMFKSWTLWKLFFIAILLNSSWSFVSQDEAHDHSLGKRLQIVTLGGTSWRWVGYLPNLAHFSV